MSSHNKALHHFMPSGCLIKIQSHYILISVSHTIISQMWRKCKCICQSPAIKQHANFDVVVIYSVQKIFKSGYCLLIEDFSSSKIFLDEAKCPLHLHPQSHNSILFQSQNFHSSSSIYSFTHKHTHTAIL